MNGVDLLRDLALVMLVAALVTVVFQRLKLPVVLGYILAGLILGPGTPPFSFVRDPENIANLADLGVVMLMFTLGLQFSLRRLAAIGLPALVAATLEIGLMVWLGFQVGRAFGWSIADSVFLGAMLLSSSTVIIARVLGDLGRTREKFAQIIFGILVVDDIFAILAIAVLSGMRPGLQGASLATFGRTGGMVVLFMAVVIVLGLILLPLLLRVVRRQGNNETMLITALGLGFGTALAGSVLGMSPALGAFLIGAVIAETQESARIKSLLEPLRDMFSAVFFVAVGLMLEPALLEDYWLPTLIITLVLILGKTFAGALGSLVAGNDARTSLCVGMGLAQIGEFAFIIAKLGKDRGVTSDFLYPIAVCVSASATMFTPFLIAHSDRIATKIDDAAPPRLKQYVNLYLAWVASLAQRQREVGQVRTLLRRWGLQMALNVVLITAVFIAAVASARWLPAQALIVPAWAGGSNTVLLLAAMFLALPLIIATLRKWRACAMLVAEAAVLRRGSLEQTKALRRVATSMFTGVGATALLIYIALLSAAILPSWPVLLVLGLIVAAITVLMWRSFIQVYARAQTRLRDTLAQASANEEPPA